MAIIKQKIADGQKEYDTEATLCDSNLELEVKRLKQVNEDNKVQLAEAIVTRIIGKIL